MNCFHNDPVKGWKTHATLPNTNTLRQHRWKHHNTIPLMMHGHPPPPRVTAKQRELIECCFPRALWNQTRKRSVAFCFIIYNTPNLSCNQPLQRQWQEVNMDGNLQEIIKKKRKTPQISKKQELRTSKPSQKRNLSQSGQQQRSCCHVQGNYSICKLCWRANLPTKRITSSNGGPPTCQMKEINSSKDNVSKWGEKAKETEQKGHPKICIAFHLMNILV